MVQYLEMLESLKKRFKIEKYGPLKDEIVRHWDMRKVSVIPVVVGAVSTAAERGRGAKCPRASKSKGPHNTIFFKVWGAHKANQQ